MVTMFFAIFGLWVVCVVLVRAGCSMTQHTQANYPDFCKDSLYMIYFEEYLTRKECRVIRRRFDAQWDDIVLLDKP